MIAAIMCNHESSACTRLGSSQCLDCRLYFCPAHTDGEVDVCVECIWTSGHNPKNQPRLDIPRFYNPEIPDLSDAIIILRRLKLEVSLGSSVVWSTLDHAINSLEAQLRPALRGR